MSSKLLSHPPGRAGAPVGDTNGSSMDLIQSRIESLSSKMDRLIHIQEKVLSRLDGMSQDIDGIERDMENMKVDHEEIIVPPPILLVKTANPGHQAGGEVREMCQEMSSIMTVVNQRSEQQAQKLEGMEKLVLGIQQVIGFIGETVKGSRVMELMFKGPAARKSAKAKDNKGKRCEMSAALAALQTVPADCELPSSTGETNKQAGKKHHSRTYLHGPKHFLTPCTYGIFLKDGKGKEAKEKPCLSLKSVKAQRKKKPPDVTADTHSQRRHMLLFEEMQMINEENTEKSGPQEWEAADSSEEPPLDVPEPHKGLEEDGKEEEEEAARVAAKMTECKISEDNHHEEGNLGITKADKEEDSASQTETPTPKDAIPASDDHQVAEQNHTPEVNTTTSSKPHETSEDDDAQSQVVDEDEERQEPESDGWAVFKADGVEIHLDLLRKLHEKSAPPPAPFAHRIVSAKPNLINNFYTINQQEMLGGGRFGQVHKCVENSSGLTLAAKVIKAKTQKEKDMVKNEIQVMNQLDHSNLIQLYAAYESRYDLILNYTLMELETVSFIRQICEGLQHMHKMYILHLDLKPENILCVSRVTNKVKIIDFGLARIYKPREKLKVNFGTPEFLAPEVVNYDFVSFNTDMWSLGVITYML
ncbi:hypothetical protein CRUP_004142 [Coryphaenoides rupestris]|nr:hypothetical protein CRUP_004142 [Coryphaenoides rupestris]